MSVEKVRHPRQRIVKLGGITTKTTAKRSPGDTRSSTPVGDPTTGSNSDTPVQNKDSPEYLQELIRKLFYPLVSGQDYKQDLPALTSSPDVDIQLYVMIGLLFRSFINKWYKNITYDTEFITELVNLITHITRDLETRLRSLDVMELLLDDLPFVFEDHLRSYRKVLKELGTSMLPFDTIDSGFDYLSNHRAFTSDPEDQELYLKLLANNIMEKMLPPDDQRSGLVSRFIGALIGDMLLKIITNKISQPYQIFEIITLVCKAMLGESSKKPPLPTQHVSDGAAQVPENNRLTSVISAISHFIADTTSAGRPDSKITRKSVSSFHIFSFLNELFLVSIHRPVLYAVTTSFIPMLRHSRIDHILSNLIQNKVVRNVTSASLFATIVKAGRSNLFPTDEDMGPPRIEPDMAEFELIRQTTKEYLIRVCKKFSIAAYLLLATRDEELDDVIDDFLTGFEHKRVNEHLVFKIIDLVVLRLIPDFGEGTRND